MKGGDVVYEDADVIWDRFYARLIALVLDRLHSQMATMSDEEDLALESLAELFQGLIQGKYPGLDNRESVWRLLVTVASRNVLDEVNRENRMKRGSGRVFNESDLASGDQDLSGPFTKVPSGTEPPDVKLMIAERCAELLESLGDKELQAIVLMKAAGFTNPEVAEGLDIGLRSVERRLSEIRAAWKTA